jgi:RHS repeat-associated protein
MRDTEQDVESQYDYFGARYYDARIGRFLAVDPHFASYPDLSPFVYACNNPLLFVDPTGMDTTATNASGSLDSKSTCSSAVAVAVKDATGTSGTSASINGGTPASWANPARAIAAGADHISDATLVLGIGAAVAGVVATVAGGPVAGASFFEASIDLMAVNNLADGVSLAAKVTDHAVYDGSLATVSDQLIVVGMGRAGGLTMDVGMKGVVQRTGNALGAAYRGATGYIKNQTGIALEATRNATAAAASTYVTQQFLNNPVKRQP